MIGKSFFSLLNLNLWLGSAVFPGVDIPGIHLSLPLVHVALSGDLQVQIIASSFPPLLMQLSRLEGNAVRPLTTFPIFPKATEIPNNISVNIPCGYFSREGLYYIVIKKQPIGWKNSTYYDPEEDSITSRSLDVRWPIAKLSISSENLETYPDHPVEATLEYPDVKCFPDEENNAEISIPEFSLALHFCGDSLLTCKMYSDQNITQGSAIETEKCGNQFTSSWNCFYGEGIGMIKDIIAEMPEVQEEVGSYCRCGCVVHLGMAKPTRLLASSSQSCPGRNFWLIQADPDSVIQFRVLQFRLVCRTQSLKIRDGNALSSNLLAHLSSASDTVSLSVNSTGANLLLEFFSTDTDDTTHICGGGFIAQANQMITAGINNITAVPVAQNVGIIPVVILKLSAVHIAAIFFLVGLLLATIVLGLQYVFRYRKYQIAEGDDHDSVSNYSGVGVPLATRATSNATLLSEVISFTKFRPHLKSRNKHVRLRESVDCDTLKANEGATLAKEESLSICSTTTLTQDEALTKSDSPDKSEENEHTPNSSESISNLKRSSTDESDKDKSDEKDAMCKQIDVRTVLTRRPSNISNSALTNGCYSSGNTMINKATIKSTSIKETKEKKNREKLLAGPTGSDFSLAAQDNDLELDYYDYNVVNAGAAPGSYLGMDPAFLVWIPPLDEDGELFPEYEKSEYHEMTAVREYADPGSNKETPEEEILLPKPKTHIHHSEPSLPKLKYKSSNNSKTPQDIDNKFVSEIQPLVHKRIVDSDIASISKKLKETKKYIREDMEKETEVEKSLDLGNVDNIKFVDDEELTDYPENQCNNMDVAYQGSNFKSSS
ncbi:unnamed protein product [Psylliodes chrysocephalus]|uniref:CUB domain-containing protein n=1 Tax=Psylliodes chrysocephalus TaxID=3402493 RepID=A0A9P0CLV4_9CUCU|nr:unnamed protein product [Psylliodes chrysocephala]